VSPFFGIRIPSDIRIKRCANGCAAMATDRYDFRTRKADFAGTDLKLTQWTGYVPCADTLAD